jgi:hypothetical protein
MAYGKLKADTLVYDNSGSDVEVTISSIGSKAPAASPTFTGNVDLTGAVLTGASPLVLEGATANAYETTIAVTDPTADRTVTIPDASGTVAYLAAPAFTGTATAVNLTLSGDLTVNGTTTTVNTSTMTVTDKNIEIAKGSANDAAADGAGITVDSGDGDKTWNWVDATDSWTSSEHIDLANGKTIKHNTAALLSSTTLGSTVLASSLTSVGTLAGLDTAGFLREAVTITAGKLSANLNLDLADGNVFLFTTQETATALPNLRYNNSTTLNDSMSVGDVASVTIITTAASAGFSAQLTIDGNAVTENWVGGSAPDAGGSSGVDIHAYTIIKTAANTYTVIANHSKTS